MTNELDILREINRGGLTRDLEKHFDFLEVMHLIRELDAQGYFLFPVTYHLDLVTGDIDLIRIKRLSMGGQARLAYLSAPSLNGSGVR
ncbi:MAG: hypothetical protein ABJB01_00155 [Rudaea sp.]